MKMIIDYILYDLLNDGNFYSTSFIKECVNMEFNTNYTTKQIYNKLSYLEKSTDSPLRKCYGSRCVGWYKKMM